MFGSYSLVIFRKLNILSLYEQDGLQFTMSYALTSIDMEMNLGAGWSRRCWIGPAKYQIGMDGIIMTPKLYTELYHLQGVLMWDWPNA